MRSVQSTCYVLTSSNILKILAFSLTMSVEHVASVNVCAEDVCVLLACGLTVLVQTVSGCRAAHNKLISGDG